MILCYICNTRIATLDCSDCKRPICKGCTKGFPFSPGVCLECAINVKTGLGGIRKDKGEIF